MKSEDVCMCVGRWVEGPGGGSPGGGEAARVSRLPLWCERHGLAGGGGGFPVCDINITSQMWKCVQSE